MLAFWMGGASASPATTQAGFRGLQAFWQGGAGATPTVTQAGSKSLLAFWMGGAYGYAASPAVEVAGSPGGSLGYQKKKKVYDNDYLLQRIYNDDEEVMLIIQTFLMTRQPHVHRKMSHQAKD